MTVASGSRTLKVGLMLPQTEGLRGPGMSNWKELREIAALAEDVGFDSIWLVDHLIYLLEGEDQARACGKSGHYSRRWRRQPITWN